MLLRIAVMTGAMSTVLLKLAILSRLIYAKLVYPNPIAELSGVCSFTRKLLVPRGGLHVPESGAECKQSERAAHAAEACVITASSLSI